MKIQDLFKSTIPTKYNDIVDIDMLILKISIVTLNFFSKTQIMVRQLLSRGFGVK